MIEITQQPMSEALKERLYKGFSNHAIQTIGYDEIGKPLAFIANENGHFAGAVVVMLFWGALHIKYLYVEEPYRGRLIATQLIREALSYGRDHQCPFAFVETMSFQALGFYQKIGFELELTRSGYNHGTSFHYLRKNL